MQAAHLDVLLDIDDAPHEAGWERDGVLLHVGGRLVLVDGSLRVLVSLLLRHRLRLPELAVSSPKQKPHLVLLGRLAVPKVTLEQLHQVGRL